ncbi:MAG: iron ABC transporter permease [Acidobacteriota bacterium]|jgi:iron complex transport system permease protein|nr:iron ABC transporter permease [Acidobacteriota bacterium]
MNEDTMVENRRYLYLFPIVALLLAASVILNLIIGTAHIRLSEILAILLGRVPSEVVESFIIFKIRMPRLVASLIGGGFLAVSGLLMQVYFRNPIVGPYILGISSGATLAVGIATLSSLSLGFAGISPYMTVLAAFIGACSVMAIVIFVASRMKSVIALLLIGIMMGYVASALTDILVAFANKEKIKHFVLWGMGSFSGFSWEEILILFFAGGAIVVGTYLMSKHLNAFLLGEEYAQSMGVNIRLFRVLLIFLSCALAALVTASAGPVGFIGLAVPHMARILFKTQNNRILIPACLLLGGFVTNICDLVARTAFSPAELPLSSITAIFGAPIVIGLIAKRRYSL